MIATLPSANDRQVVDAELRLVRTAIKEAVEVAGEEPVALHAALEMRRLALAGAAELLAQHMVLLERAS